MSCEACSIWKRWQSLLIKQAYYAHGEIKAIGGCFYILLGYKSDTKCEKKRKKKKECVHVKQPTQSVPQSKVLSIKIALNVHGALHMGIVLFQYSSAVFIFFFFFNCRPLRHSVVGKLVKVSFSNFRKTNWLHSEIRHLVITIVLPAICVWTYHNCGIQDEETRLMCLLL